MKIRNFTGHTLDYFQTMIRSEGIAQVEEDSQMVGTATTPDGLEVSIIKKSYFNTVGLPPPQEGVLYAVSSIVANANPSRNDLVCPLTKRRNRRIYCTGFRHDY